MLAEAGKLFTVKKLFMLFKIGCIPSHNCPLNFLVALFPSRTKFLGGKPWLYMYACFGCYLVTPCVHVLFCRCPGFQKLSMVSGDGKGVPAAFVDFSVRVYHSLSNLISLFLLSLDKYFSYLPLSTSLPYQTCHIRYAYTYMYVE